MGYTDRAGRQVTNAYGIDEHFERGERGWLYFRDGWRAPVLVTPEERDRLISWHENGTLAMLALVMIAGVTVFFAPLPLIGKLSTDVQKFVALVVVISVLAVAWKAFERRITAFSLTRTPIAAPRDRQFLARRRIENTSWKKIIFGFVGFTALVVLWAFQDNSIWQIWLAMLLITLHQAYRKWQLERRPTTSTFP